MNSGIDRLPDQPVAWDAMESENDSDVACAVGTKPTSTNDSRRIS